MSNDLIAAREDQTEWYTGLGIAESIADISSGVESESWIEAGIGIVATAGEAAAWATDPFGQIIQYGVSWLMEHLQPLRDALDWLAGDPPQIEAYAQTWRNVSEAVATTATTLRDRSQADTSSWQGTAANAYRSHATALALAIDDTAKTAELISYVVSIAGLLVASVRELVRDMIAELVAILVERAWLWAAETATIIGAPAAEAQISALVAKWVGKVARVIAKLVRSLNNLDGLTKKLDEVGNMFRDAWRRLRGEDSKKADTEAEDPIAAPDRKPPDTKGSADAGQPDATPPSAGPAPGGSVPDAPEGGTTKPAGAGDGTAPERPADTGSTPSPAGSGSEPPGDGPPTRSTGDPDEQSTGADSPGERGHTVTPEHYRELGYDPATKQFRESEADTAVRIEGERGVHLTRSEVAENGPDWEGSDGKSYDAVGNFDGRYFDRQWPRLQERIVDHLEKADYVPVDVSRFTPEQVAQIKEFIGPLGPRVFLVGE